MLGNHPIDVILLANRSRGFETVLPWEDQPAGDLWRCVRGRVQMRWCQPARGWAEGPL